MSYEHDCPLCNVTGGFMPVFGSWLFPCGTKIVHSNQKPKFGDIISIGKACHTTVCLRWQEANSALEMKLAIAEQRACPDCGRELKKTTTGKFRRHKNPAGEWCSPTD